MTRQSLIIIILLTVIGCKKENETPLPEITSIVGKWRATEYRQTIGDSTTIQPLSRVNSWTYEFRSDGIILNKNGKIPCCLPLEYFLNGKQFWPKPVIPAELDPVCAYSLCAACPEMQITQTSSDSLRIETCKGSFTSFVREAVAQ